MMSAFHTISPLLRRNGTLPNWTCRACIQSRGRAVPQFARRSQEGDFATKVQGGRGPVGTETANAAKPNPGPNAKPGPKGRRRRRLVVAGGALTIGAAAVTINDDAKHAYTATKRSYRVLETLVLNIKEYVDFTTVHWV
jgi:aarF domain-containing kinase